MKPPPTSHLPDASKDRAERLHLSLSALREISDLLTSEKAFEKVAEGALRGILGLVGASQGVLLTYEETGGRLHLSVARGIRKGLPSSVDTGKSLRACLVSTRAPILLDRRDAWPRALTGCSAAIQRLHADVWIPLTAKGRLLGILSIGGRSIRQPYGQDDLHLLWTAGHLLSEAIHRQHLLTEVREANFQLNRRVVELETLYDVGLTLSASLRIEEVIEEVLLRAVGIVDARAGFLFLKDGRDLVLAHQTGLEGRPCEALRAPAMRRRMRRVMGSGKPLHIRPEGLPADLRSNHAAVVPIGDLGVLGVVDKESRQGTLPFTEADAHLLELVGQQAGAALANARLYRGMLEVKNDNQNILSSIGSGVITTDLRGRVVRMNPSAARLLGGQAPRTGRSIAAFFRGSGCAEISSAMVESLADGKNRLVGPAKVSGTDLTINARITALRNDAGEIQGLVVSLENLTEEMRIRARFEQSQEHALLLEETNRHVQEASRLKSMILASASHELRTPMTSIMGFTNLVLKGAGDALPEKQRENLLAVKINADRLLKLINDILDLSKIEAGYMKVRPIRFVARNTIAGCCAMVRPIVTPEVALVSEVPDEVGEVFTDEALLRQVLTNLLGNALKFTESGEIRVRARRLPHPGIPQSPPAQEGGVASAAAGPGEWLEVAVSDTGIGIPEEAIGYIFEAFRQVEGVPHHRGGTGLGLAISKKLAELLGGTLGVESVRGKGSTFTVRIPAHYLPVSASPGPPARLPAEPSPGAPLEAPRRQGDERGMGTLTAPPAESLPEDGGRKVDLTIPMVPDMELAAGKTAEAVAEFVGLRWDKVEDIKMALIEACINAMEHSRSQDRRVYITFQIGDQELAIRIEDRGQGFDPGRARVEAVGRRERGESRRGWGLKLMEDLMDEVRIQSDRNGTVITMLKRR